MTRRNGILVLTAVVLLTVGGLVLFNMLGGDPGVAKVSLRLPIPVVHTSFAPFYLAVDEGLFLKHGLDVRIEPGSPELNPVMMVSQGIDEFGIVGGPELLLSGRSRGAGIIGIALLHKDADFVVIATLKDSGLTDVSQLEGKRVGFYYGHISTDILRMLFKKEGVRVEEVDVGFNYGPLISREIDAQWAFRTTAGLTLPQRGVALNLISPAEHGVETQGHMLIANEALLEREPEVVQRFLTAVLEGIDLALRDPEAAIDSAVRRDPNFDREIGRQQMEILGATIRANSRTGWIPAEAMERTKEQMLSVDLLPQELDVHTAYTTWFLEQYYEARRP